MIDLGLLHYCLGLEVWQMQDQIFVAQMKYTKSLLEKFGMSECESMKMPIEPVLHLLRHDSYGLEYKKNDKFILIGYTDAKYGGSLDDKRSTTRYVFFLGSRPISWGSKEQTITSKSTIELEYRAAGDDVCEVVWLHRILTDIGIPQQHPTVLHCDDQSLLKMVRNHVFH